MSFPRITTCHQKRTKQASISITGILENGGNVTLSTLRKVIDVLPNLEELGLAKVRMKPAYFDMENYDWPRSTT